MTKYSDDSKEIGASSVPNIVIPFMFLQGLTDIQQAPFQTREEQRQKTIAAQRGTKIEDNRYAQAKDRGHRLEPACLEYGADHIQSVAGDSIIVAWGKPTDADRYPKLKIAASCDAHIHTSETVYLTNPDGTLITATGDGVMEAKTDKYSDGEPRLDQIIQLNTQMACTGRDWGIIAKYGKSHYFSVWPYHFDQELWDITKTAITEFWDKVENDIPYDPIEVKKPEPIELETFINNKDTTKHIHRLAKNIKKHRKNAETEKKLADDAKQQIEDYFNALEIKSATVRSHYKKDIIKISLQEVVTKSKPEHTVPAKPSSSYNKLVIEEVTNE